mmetsp:Transcript_24634/g.50878  ORF Transcript_24634/g.50878 Transcript_24634/m.50878 type:complete len:274 (+) Transcript_24634:1009-1830(+)
MLHVVPHCQGPARAGQDQRGGLARARQSRPDHERGYRQPEVLPHGHAGDPPPLHHHPLRQPDHHEGRADPRLEDGDPEGHRCACAADPHEPRQGDVGESERVQARALLAGGEEHWRPHLGQERLPAVRLRQPHLHRQPPRTDRGHVHDRTPHAEVPLLPGGGLQARAHPGHLAGVQERCEGQGRTRRDWWTGLRPQGRPGRPGRGRVIIIYVVARTCDPPRWPTTPSAYSVGRLWCAAHPRPFGGPHSPLGRALDTVHLYQWPARRLYRPPPP